MSKLNDVQLLHHVEAIAQKELKLKNKYLMNNIHVNNGIITYHGRYSDNSFSADIRIIKNPDGSYHVTSKQSPYYYDSQNLYDAIDMQCLINSKDFCQNHQNHRTVAEKKQASVREKHVPDKQTQLESKLNSLLKSRKRFSKLIKQSSNRQDLRKLKECLSYLNEQIRQNKIAQRILKSQKSLNPRTVISPNGVVADETSNPSDDDFIQNYNLNSDENSDNSSDQPMVDLGSNQAMKKPTTNYSVNHLSKSALARKYHIGNVDDVIDLSHDGMKELNNMIGLKNVKEQMKDYIADAKVAKRLNQLGQKTQLKSLNLIFMGNPGTGKTVVARLVGKIMFQNQIIRKPLFKECGVKSLVGRYAGQTAPKTAKLVKSALGGVLFIDEAYGLAPSGSNDGDNNYKEDAVSELLRLSEKYRDDLVIILAGYKDRMEDLLKNGNEGLRSRFNHKIIFHDYNNYDMYRILMYLAHKQNCNINGENKHLIQKKLGGFISDAKKHHDNSNGRLMRNLLDGILECRNRRISNHVNQMYIPQINIISSDDVEKGFKKVRQNI